MSSEPAKSQKAKTKEKAKPPAKGQASKATAKFESTQGFYRNATTQTPPVQSYETKLPLRQQPQLQKHDPQKRVNLRLATKVVDDDFLHKLLAEVIEIHLSTSGQVLDRDLPPSPPDTYWRTFRVTNTKMYLDLIRALRISQTDWNNPGSDILEFKEALAKEYGPDKFGRISDLYNHRQYRAFLSEYESWGLVISGMDYSSAAPSDEYSALSGAIYHFAVNNRPPDHCIVVYGAGLHNDPDDLNDRMEGTKGMIISICLQLMKFMKDKLDMSFASPDQLKLIEMEDFDALLNCFSSLIFSIARAGTLANQSMPVWILIDGLNHFEDKNGYMYGEDMRFMNLLRAHVFFSLRYGGTGISLKYLLLHPKKAFAKCTDKEQFYDVRSEARIWLPTRTDTDRGAAKRGAHKFLMPPIEGEPPGPDTLGDLDRHKPKWNPRDIGLPPFQYT